MVQVVPALWRVHWLQVVRLFGASGPARGCSGPLVVCSILLSALSLFSRCIVFEYGPISRFKGVFSAVWGCCAGLCRLRALRGLWGFCVRE